MNKPLLRRINAGEICRERKSPVDSATLEDAARIIEAVREGGEEQLRRFAEHFGDLQPGAPLFLGKESLQQAYESLDEAEEALLQRTAGRIRSFAEAQRAALREMESAVPGGTAGHWIAPVKRAGCYAPGGRYPLPSSVLMTAVTARAAGVDKVIVASPKPGPAVRAAAWAAGADGLLAAGGAHAIAALAYGAGPIDACDVIVGPGNRWVTAAKQLVNGRVATDLPAGPSELVIVADSSADAAWAAADLLAQAEHDPDAFPALVALDETLFDAVNAELARQLGLLGTAETAMRALNNGFFISAESMEHAVRIVDELAPEHLELMVQNAEQAAPLFQHYGGIFIGTRSAEVFGDYGAGPNHVLPTSGAARYAGGLSVFNFLRIRTWLRITDSSAAAELCRDAAKLARMEGLQGHERAALVREGSS